MKTKLAIPPTSWTRLGGPPAGTVPAIALGFENESTTLFAGAQIGVYRSSPFQADSPPVWQRLADAPSGVMALAVSPFYSEDHTLLAGTGTGIWVSQDAGESWSTARMSLANASVLCLAFSPDYLSDGVILAGSLQDGIFYSNDRGQSWTTRNFGLLDSTVLALAFSPDFARDGTVFAATDTALYFSYNHARAWKQIHLPEDAAPILSLAVSSQYPIDQTVFAGTETGGLFRSTDRGIHWTQLGVEAGSINALGASQSAEQQVLWAATEAGMLRSLDRGDTWTCELDSGGVISLAIRPDLTLAGIVDGGLWVQWDTREWEAVEGLSMRTLLGLALPNRFEHHQIAFLYGPNEGIWKTHDSGESWQDLDEALPTLEIYGLAAHPDFDQNHRLAAASDLGVLTSADAGESWQSTSPEPAEQVAYSPNGKILAASFPGAGIRYSQDQGISWSPLPGPWDVGGKVLALAVTNLHYFYVALLEAMGATVSFWQGKADPFENIFSQAATPNPVVALWVPAEAAAGRPWFAAMGSTVWKFNAHPGGSTSASQVFTQGQAAESILCLAGIPTAQHTELLACTGPRLYSSLDGETWTLMNDFGNDRVLQVIPGSPDRPAKTVYALFLGGIFARLAAAHEGVP